MFFLLAQKHRPARSVTVLSSRGVRHRPRSVPEALNGRFLARFRLLERLKLAACLRIASNPVLSAGTNFIDRPLLAAAKLQHATLREAVDYSPAILRLRNEAAPADTL
jgi:hypothetical protein